MRFNPKARLDTSRVGDAGRGSGGRGGGGRIPIPGGVAGGGGIVGTVIVIVFVLVQVLSGNGGGGSDASGLDSSRFSDGRYDDCTTGADANASPDCARVAVENSLRDFWSDI